MPIIDKNVLATVQKYAIAHQEFSCNPDLADTAAFCEHYGFTADESANTIIVASRTDPVQYAACLVLANTRLDVNKTVRSLMGVKKASFASSEQTKDVTGMMIGGVTVFGLPEDIPIYVDSRIMECKRIVVGGGNRSSKVILSPAELLKIPSVRITPDLAKQLPQE